MRSLAERFWEKVDKTDECWIWIAGCRNGYGVISIGGRGAPIMDAHRVAWILAHGSIPDTLQVLHTCDVKRCVRIDHLYLGDHAQNMRDALERGLATPPPRLTGIHHPSARFTQQEVDEIRRLYATSAIRQADIAGLYGVSQRTISRMIRRTSYAR